MLEYMRYKVVDYCHKWAFKRNPNYLNFDDLGGDCTNFASQSIFAGSGVMNFTPIYGWYYISSSDRTASWTGVQYLYNFLIDNRKNEGSGPVAEQVDIKDIDLGDIIQLSFDGKDFVHSPIVVRVGSPASLDNIFIAAHSYDRYDYPITNYIWKDIRFLHIIGTNE